MKSPTEQLTEIMASKVPEFSLVELHKPLTSAGIKDAANILVLKAILSVALLSPIEKRSVLWSVL